MRRPAALLLVALLALLVWDASALDLALIRLWGTPAGFPWHDQWFASAVVHTGGHWAALAIVAALFVNLRWPLPLARGVPLSGRIWWLATTLACLAAVALVKRASLTSCPSELVEFGGGAHYVSHWLRGLHDGGSGHCFPSGHASSAFAMLAGAFALAESRPRAARLWLGAVLAAGTLFGFVQMIRGAHYASHTLWTAWLCACITVASHGLAKARRPFDLSRA